MPSTPQREVCGCQAARRKMLQVLQNASRISLRAAMAARR